MTDLLEAPAPPEQTHTGVLHVIDSTGDSRFMWDASKPVEVEAAKAQFDSLKAQGYLAYSVDTAGGGAGEVVREFDPNAQALIMRPQLVGG